MTIFDEPTVIMSKERGLAGTGMTEPRALQIESDIADILALPTITDLDDLGDVDTFGVVDGDTLLYNSAGAGGVKWIPGAPATAIDIYRGTAGAEFVGEANRLDFEGGLYAEDVGGATRKKIYILFAGTGAANTVAHSDHFHTESFKRRKEWTYGAVVSSGTPTLDTFATQTLATGIVYDIDVDVVVDAYGSGGAASSARIIIEIDGVATTGTAKVYEAGVNGDKHLSAVATITGAGGTKNIVTKMQFVSGAGPNVVGGYTKYAAGPRR